MAPLEKQMRAAVTVHPYKASQILEFFQDRNVNNVPDRRRFLEVFTFSPEQLRNYISEGKLEDELIGVSLDQRIGQSAYVQPRDHGYLVGWFDSERRYEQILQSKLDAVTEFVLLFWGLPPLNPRLHPGRASASEWPGSKANL